MTPSLEQRLALDALLSERVSADGQYKWAALEAAIICGRQNLKTWVLQMSVLHDLFIRTDVRQVIWTAHRFKTTESAFRDFQSYIDNNDFLRKRVASIHTGAADKSIVLQSGARLDFLARTSGGGRGLTGDVIVLDEALYLSGGVMAALLPTLSAKSVTGNPQVRYGSSAGESSSDILRSLRDRGRAGDDPSLVYVEWSTERGGCGSDSCDHGLSAKGCQLDDPTQWAAANPSLGWLITPEYISAERRAMPPLEFARERLGWWDDPLEANADSGLSEELWAVCCDPASTVPDGAPIAFAVDTSWDRATTHVAIAARLADGLSHVEIVASCASPDDAVEWLRSRVARYSPCAIVLQAGSPAASMVLGLDRLSVPVHMLNVGQLAQACGSLFDAVKGQGVRHIGQSRLDAAVRDGRMRNTSDALVWDRKRSVTDISGLVAVTEALWALQAYGDSGPAILNIWGDE
jgi:hypothetical protein